MSIKKNILANYVGNAWSALIGVAFVPIYLRYIGPEGYGLVGFFTMILSISAVLDAGFGAAASRELAKTSSVLETSDNHVGNLIRTLEWVFWAIAAVLGVLLVLLAPLIARDWLHTDHMDPREAINALRLMGIALILQWPTAYYRACITGLQKQVGLNTISSITATVRGIGAVLTLWLISPTIHAFFLWQVVAAFANVVALQKYLWRNMPIGCVPPRFHMQSLQVVGRFAVGVGAVNIMALVLTQLDKIVVSKLLPLDIFGYYTLAATLAALIYQLIGPVFNAFYPRLTQVTNEGDMNRVTIVYRRACQTMALSVIPFALLIVFFGREMIWVWTGNFQLAQSIKWVVASMAIGTMLNGLVTIPYALQLANGWTTFAFWQNLLAVSLVVPLTYVLATSYGMLGAAMTWPILNFGYVTLGVSLMYRKLLRQEMRYWYTYSIVVPIVAVALFMATARAAMGYFFSACTPFQLVTMVGSIFVISLGICGFVMPQIRSTFRQTLAV